MSSREMHQLLSAFTILLVTFTSDSQIIERVTYEKSLCKQERFMCFGSKNGVASWSSDSGCIADDSCSILLFAARDTVVVDGISGASGENTSASNTTTSSNRQEGKITWTIEAPFTQMERQELHFSVSEHPKGFDAGTEYVWANTTRKGTDAEEEYESVTYIHTACNKEQDIECPQVRGPDSTMSCFKDFGQGNTRTRTSVFYQTKETLWRKITDVHFKPYVDLIQYPLFVHIKEIKNGKVTENVSSKGHFFLFKAKDATNNPDKVYDPNVPLRKNPGGIFTNHTGNGTVPKVPAEYCPDEPATKSKEVKSKTTTYIIIAVVVIAIILAILLCFCCCCGKKEKKPGHKHKPHGSKSRSSSSKSSVSSQSSKSGVRSRLSVK